MHRSVAATCGGFVLASAFVLGGRVGHGASAPGVMDSWPVLPAGEFVYVAGVVGRRPGSQELADGIEAQVRQAIENVRAVLRSEGLDLSHVVSSNVFLSDARNFQAMNEVYRTHFPNDPPTRATVEADLPEKQKPGLVYGHVPDLKAVRDDHRIIGEVETCNSISWTETRDQFVAFTKARREGWEFHALTPESCVQDLEAQVADWRGQGYDVTVDRYWWV